MIEYEIQRLRSAELIRKAEDYRRGRELLRLRRAARKADGDPAQESRAHTHEGSRPRIPRTA
ncbi:hypothetical protein AAW14_19615 [Streptomyces hygroscopicus]|uniref:hypothetical protein n=1 Tax=Streptomyces hygroscopicus TaxID=1912 RepID=UPI00224028EB|nr:hypothetical protein [Streptomyces hygroscopicus]MCW7944192.1 hypothetical protein [Streptomyces hygroscopicus]